MSTTDLPTQLVPIYSTPAINAPVELYRGPLTVESKGKSFTREGRIMLEWLPSPSVNWVLDGVAVPPLFGEVFLKIPSIPNPVRAQLTGVNTSAAPSAKPPSTSGYIENGEGRQWDGLLETVVFHLANFVPFLGAPVRSGAGGAAARATLRAGGWLITLDRLAETPSDDGLRRRNRSGYGISHVGHLQREGGELFSVADAKGIFDDLYWFFSFCRGKPAPPILPVGFSAQGEQVWSEWASWNVGPDQQGRNWYNDFSVEGLEQVFTGFVERSKNALWSVPMRNAVYWYLEADRVGNDSAVILVQAALELLAWTLLVEEQSRFTQTQFNKLRAAEQLARLLTALDIPLTVPSTLEALHVLMSQRRWVSGPELLVGLRNAMVHGGGKQVSDPSAHTFFEASSLGLWYLEMALLRLFKYSGKYSNRLILSGWKGEDVQDVPWGTSVSRVEG